MNQKPQNPFRPGDRVVKAEDEAQDASVAVVIEVLPPEKEVGIYGQTFDGEAVQVAFPSSLDTGPGDWRDIHPALLASYCHDQEVKCYTYKHTNLDFAPNPYVPGDRVIKASHDDPDVAIVVENGSNGDVDTVDVVYSGQFEDSVPPAKLASYCEEQNIKRYSYNCSDLGPVEAE